MALIITKKAADLPKPKKPVIGLALGSGAAKGWAHIGVLNGLAKLGIFPDKVAGCSVGALVGAAYANDNLDEIEKWVRGFSSWDVLGLMDIRWRKGGIINGEKVFEVLSSRVGALKIEQLKRAFAAVATDLYSGQEIWFREGDLRHAVRASCSMPGFLPPVQQDDRWLVDGAVVNPVPVSLCRAMGVDLVIAVDLNGHRRGQMMMLPEQVVSHQAEKSQTVTEKPQLESGFMDLWGKSKEYLSGLTEKFSLGVNSHPGMLAVMSQSMDILEQRHKRARLMGDPPDICIVPQVFDIGTMEFHRAAEAIAAGEQAVENISHLLKASIGDFDSAPQR
ncbi:Patatin [Shewanella denitrificans OS217]|jgi:NTE family protein|uniref:Patatin n=1 Tax=Shewanella denitrificans (strain OS217 / ATCC BAA-1090 / DSM 15013) TaxID=318161 RepID=Q12PC2_SHEDO|nr:patatin-like phospholipase RssA [Shewanella denitrificans]ABE54704.1 Patatin [Shewanella denitrificans OS217]